MIIIEAIEKLRNIEKWAGWQSESFNTKLKSISIIEKIYDYCMANDLEFADDFDFDSEEENEKYRKDIEKIAGVKLY
jgi:hypothetical protein